MLTHKAIRKLLEKLTPWPWETDIMGYIRGLKNENILEDQANSYFVEKSPEIVEQLLKEVEDLEKDVLTFNNDCKKLIKNGAAYRAVAIENIKKLGGHSIFKESFAERVDEEAKRLIEGGE